jgi:hypothetical protein
VERLVQNGFLQDGLSHPQMGGEWVAVEELVD